MPPTLERVLVGLVILAVIVAAWYFTAGDDSSTPHNGAPAIAATAEVVPTTTG